MKLFSILFVAIFFSVHTFGGCIPFADALQHVGETRCIKGKVISVQNAEPGFVSLQFCREARKCGFTALVAVPDGASASTLSELEGRTVTIHGFVKTLNGSALIVLADSRQLLPESEVPSFMKSFDVEDRGHYSAGTSHAPKVQHTTIKKQTATLPVEIPEDSEE